MLTLYLWLMMAYSQGQLPAAFPSNGLYRRAIDFEERHLLYSFETKQQGWRWRTGRGGPGAVVLSTPDTMIRADESTYWGFRSQGKNYRFYGGQTYEIFDYNGIVVYQVETSGIESGGGYFYYFSASPVAPVMPLSRKQLRLTFAHSPRLIQLLDSLPHSASLVTVLPHQRHTRIVELFRLSEVSQSTEP